MRNEREHERRVSSGHGVVLVTGQQNLIERRADAAVAGLDDGEAEVARRVLDAIEVAGDDPAGRDENATASWANCLLCSSYLYLKPTDSASARAAAPPSFVDSQNGSRRRVVVAATPWPRRIGGAAAATLRVEGLHDAVVGSRGASATSSRGIDADVDGEEVTPEHEPRLLDGLDEPIEDEAGTTSGNGGRRRHEHGLSPP